MPVQGQPFIKMLQMLLQNALCFWYLQAAGRERGIQAFRYFINTDQCSFGYIPDSRISILWYGQVNDDGRYLKSH